jgi:hypothetical protein
VLFVGNAEVSRSTDFGRRGAERVTPRFPTEQVAVQPLGNKWEGAKSAGFDKCRRPGASTRRELFEQTITPR